VHEHDLASVPLEKASAGILIGRGLLISPFIRTYHTPLPYRQIIQALFAQSYPVRLQCYPQTPNRIISSNMKQASIFLSLAYLALCSKHHANVHSFQLQYRPQPYRNSLAKVNVGFFNPGDWSDMKPNHDEKDIIVLSSESTLSPIQSAWTKYGMIAYVAHMCAFLPLSLLPTYIQTKLGR
jgi:hypothetical protein